MSLNDRLQQFLDGASNSNCTRLRSQTIQQTHEALRTIEQAYERYAEDEIAISYNGGKDCLVLLVLLVTYLQVHSESYKDRSKPIQTVYVSIKDPFIEVDDFVAATAAEYGLKVVKIQKPMKAAFAAYLEERPSVQAILVGTRRNDPHGSLLSFFDETDQGWPKFMRVHPIINWTYSEVWDFLRGLQIPYCVLYDRGYTSLGGTGDTLPNPSLECHDVANGSANPDTADSSVPIKRYRPAWQLANGEEERLGRDRAREKSQEEVTTMNSRSSIDFNHDRR